MGAPGPDLLVGKIRFEVEGLRRLIQDVREGLGGNIALVDQQLEELQGKFGDLDLSVLNEEQKQEILNTFQEIDRDYNRLQEDIRREAIRTADEQIKQAQRAAEAQQRLLLQVSGALAAAAGETINQITEGILNEESTQDILERVRTVATGLAAGLGAIIAGPIGAAIGAAGTRAIAALADFVASTVDESEQFAEVGISSEQLERWNEATERQARLNQLARDEQTIREGTADTLERVIEKQRELRRQEEDRRRILTNAGATQITLFEQIARDVTDTSDLEQEQIRNQEELQRLRNEEERDLKRIIELEKEQLNLQLEIQTAREKANQQLAPTIAELARLGVPQGNIQSLLALGEQARQDFGASREGTAELIARLSQGEGTTRQTLAELDRLIPGITAQIAEQFGTSQAALQTRALEVTEAQDPRLRNEVLQAFLDLLGQAPGGVFDRALSPEGQAEEQLARQARGIDRQVDQQQETIRTIEKQISITEKQLEEEQETQRTTVQPLEEAARAFQLAGLGSQEQLLKDQLTEQKRIREDAEKQKDELEEQGKILDKTAENTGKSAAALQALVKKGIGATVTSGA